MMVFSFRFSVFGKSNTAKLYNFSSSRFKLSAKIRRLEIKNPNRKPKTENRKLLS